MKAILINTGLGLLWLVLTIFQVRMMGTLAAESQLGTGASVMMWLGGQCIILSPILVKIWRERALGNMPS